MTGQNGLYPSRSELIRVAVRSFLIRELDAAKSFEKYQLQSQQRAIPQQKPDIDENLFVQVPLGENPVEGSTEYKTYKLIKK